MILMYKYDLLYMKVMRFIKKYVIFQWIINCDFGKIHLVVLSATFE